MKPAGSIYTKCVGSLPEFARKPFGKCTDTGTIALLCIALFVIILAVYMQTGNHQFLNFDDDAYVTKNPHVANGITIRNVAWAFTSIESYNWHPLTWLSHMADVELFGMNPRGHHLINVALHALSSLLLFLLLVRVTGGVWQSAFVAALFALHPLHVESVAWIAERKDVLSAFFCFLALIVYAEYVAKRKASRYILSLFLFVMGLMSKPMLVTLPVIMLLLDFWPLGRIRFEEEPERRQCIGLIKTLIREKIPFFACSLLSCLITIYAQHRGGAISDLTVTPLWFRIENALIAYVKYIGKVLWPHNLAIYYPLPPSLPLWQVVTSLLILFLLSLAAIRTRRRHPWFAVGWFWFLVTLVPVIGIVQVGGQSMADRYTYIPAVGLFIIAAWGIPELTKGWRYRQSIVALLACSAVIVSAAITWHQLGYWRDSTSIYKHTLMVTSGSDIIHNNLGLVFADTGDTGAAIREYRKALLINPNLTEARNNLGIALESEGDQEAAIQEYHEVLRISPDDARARYNLGCIFQAQGNLDAAIQHYREAIRIKPDYANAHNNLGTALSIKGNLKEAIYQFQETLRIDPDYTNASINLEILLSQKGTTQ